MFKRILCPVDFSPTSFHAIDHAAAVARWYQASVTALHVYDPGFMPVSGSSVPAERVSEADIARVHGEVVAGLEAATIADLDVQVLVDVGKVAPSHATRTSSLPFKRVLRAVDFSEWSRRAFELARSLAQESQAGLTAVAVIEWPWPEPPAPVFAELPAEQADALSNYRRQRETATIERLTKLAGQPAPTNVAFEPRISHGKPHVEILRTAADIGADLIVIGIHGRNMLDLQVFGSTTNQVVRQATCPVLTLRSPN